MTNLPITPMTGKDALERISAFMMALNAAGGVTEPFTEEQDEEMGLRIEANENAILAKLDAVTDKEFIDLVAALSISMEVLDSVRDMINHMGGTERMDGCIRVVEDMGAL